MPDATDPDQPAQQRPVESGRADHRPWHYRSAAANASSPFLPRDPLRRRWHNAALRIGTSTRVHAVRFDRGPGDHERVAPACHTGHDRADHSEDLHPVRDEPVSCAHCLSHPVAFSDGQPYEPGRNQLILPLPGVPPPPSWPPVNPAEQPPPPDT